MNDTAPQNKLQPIIFSAPFGNYLGGPGITSTLGTFTMYPRGGFFTRLWRGLKTIRYSPLLRAWTNKLGLPNPGIIWLERKVRAGKIDLSDKIVSIHGSTMREWFEMISCMGLQFPQDKPSALAYELNFSCPNVEQDPIKYGQIVSYLRDKGPDHKHLIVKLPPVGWQSTVESFRAIGVKHFHCCNTLHVARGGMSGKPLKPLSLEVVRAIHAADPSVTIIGGGGITCEQDMRDYHAAGARHFALGSGLFNPITLMWIKRFAGRLDFAERFNQMLKGR